MTTFCRFLGETPRCPPYLLRYSCIFLIYILLCGCANEKYILYSDLDTANKRQLVRLNEVDYSTESVLNTKFNLLGMLGYISINNSMAYDEKSREFQRITLEPTLITIKLINQNKLDSLLISNVSGDVLAGNNGVIPAIIELLYNKETCQTSNASSKLSITMKNLVQVQPRQSVCYIFYYYEHFNPKIKFNFNFGTIQKEKAINALNLNLVPVVVKSSSH